MTTVLLASDADWLIEEVRSALSDPGTDVMVVRAGADVRYAVSTQSPELVILDLQIGNMGGMATCMDLQLEIGAGRITNVPILMLLDRSADVYLAQQAGAQGWLVKPLDSFRLKVASVKLLAGEDMRDEIIDVSASKSDSITPEDLVAEGDENQNDEPAEVG
ncbi:MAG: response regulator [Acidimicrobiales bacterium]|nr:response regulator [Acidimicrobiales bacterium]MDP6900740.1 response regulator [Acidimicrobiales bacterium]HJL98710.1 response regulator [Acidimicrobiales bacterium]